jgi:hypothetical protein
MYFRYTQEYKESTDITKRKSMEGWCESHVDSEDL